MKIKTSNHNLVSIVVPAYNEENNIYSLVKSISEQSYKKIELILGDDCSTDDTVAEVKKCANKLGVTLIVARAKLHQERGVARNMAAKKAKGEYLLFIDADMRLDKYVVEDCVRLMKDYQGVIIPEISLGKGFWARCRTLEKKCYIGDDNIEAVRFFVANNFWKVGGWDVDMISGEDWDLTRRYRKNNLVARTKYPIYHYEGSLSLRSSMSKKYYYATQSSRYFSKNKISGFNVFLFIFRPAYFRHWKDLLQDPVHAFGMVFLKLCLS